MTHLLVSVRSPEEAEAALGGGADVIDVKEPAHGALGRATDTCVADIVGLVAGRRPVSAALGEWCERAGEVPGVDGLSFLKWGFAGLGRPYAAELAKAAARLDHDRAAWPGCGFVTVAYADSKRAGAPTPTELCRFACSGRWGPFLLDTWAKDGSTLLDHLPLSAITALVERCRTAGIPVALAGSLGQLEMQALMPLRPDWFGVRGAVCRGRQRLAGVDATEVWRLAAWLADRNSAIGSLRLASEKYPGGKPTDGS
jgi:uncharacterized protein (UPF0264 family)